MSIKYAINEGWWTDAPTDRVCSQVPAQFFALRALSLHECLLPPFTKKSLESIAEPAPPDDIVVAADKLFEGHLIISGEEKIAEMARFFENASATAIAVKLERSDSEVNAHSGRRSFVQHKVCKPVWLRRSISIPNRRSR